MRPSARLNGRIVAVATEATRSPVHPRAGLLALLVKQRAAPTRPSEINKALLIELGVYALVEAA